MIKQTKTIEHLKEQHKQWIKVENDKYGEIVEFNDKLKGYDKLTRQRDQANRDHLAASEKVKEFVAMLKEQGIEEHEL